MKYLQIKAASRKFLNSCLYLFDITNDLRIHVVFNYFLVVSWFLYSSGLSVSRAVTYATLAACFGGFSYLLNRYTDYGYDVVADKGLSKVPRHMYLVIAGIFFALGSITVFHHPDYIYPVILGVVLGVLYSVKTFFLLPIKNYFLIKNIYAASAKYVATMIGVLMVVPFSEHLFVRSLSMFAFHLIYEILWDIRDIESDKIGKVSTIANTYGKKMSICVCIAIWVASFGVQYLEVNHSDYFFIKYGVVLFFILTLIFITHVRWYHVAIYIHLVLSLVYINQEVIFYLKNLFN